MLSAESEVFVNYSLQEWLNLPIYFNNIVLLGKTPLSVSYKGKKPLSVLYFSL